MKNLKKIVFASKNRKQILGRVLAERPFEMKQI